MKTIRLRYPDHVSGELHGCQKEFLDDMGAAYTVQTENFIPLSEIAAFAAWYDRLFVHFDVDVLDERFFHSTYFADPALSGDGSGGGKMTVEQLAGIFRCVRQHGNAAFTIAEYLPFEEYRLRGALSEISLFTE